MRTTYGTEISRNLVANRTDDLVGQFFKILPLKEKNAETLPKYIDGLIREMLGMQDVIEEWHEDGCYLSLIGILKYFDKHPECDVEIVRSDVFKALNIIRQLQKKYRAET